MRRPLSRSTAAPARPSRPWSTQFRGARRLPECYDCSHDDADDWQEQASFREGFRISSRRCGRGGAAAHRRPSRRSEGADRGERPAHAGPRNGEEGAWDRRTRGARGEAGEGGRRAEEDEGARAPPGASKADELAVQGNAEPQRPREDLEAHGRRSGLLAVELERERLVGVDRYDAAAEKLEAWVGEVLPAVRLRQHEEEVTLRDVPDEEDVEEAVIRLGVRRHHHASAEVAAVAHHGVDHPTDAGLAVDRDAHLA